MLRIVIFKRQFLEIGNFAAKQWWGDGVPIEE